MNLASALALQFGGPGSGCRGPNCGRKAGTWREDPLAKVPDVLYRGTGPGSFDQTARDFEGGELGGGIYFTPHKEVAEGYTEGPGHVTHEVEWVRKPLAKETGYVYGYGQDLGGGVMSRERLIDGTGKELGRFELGGDDFGTERARLKQTALESGLKVLVGLSNVSGAGQIAVLDRSMVRPRKAIR